MNNSANKETKSFFVGLLSGVLGSVAVYPIDVVKTKMQNQTIKIYSNGFICAQDIWKKQGIKGFYRGLIPQIIGVGPEKAVKLFVYNKLSNGSDNIYNHFVGGLCGGACQVLVTTPYELYKINQQMNIKIKNINIYKGIGACFLRDIPFSGIYFPLYWYLKEKQKFNSFAAGTVAGIPAALLCTPADVLKTRVQTYSNTNSNSNIINLTKSIIKNEGYGALWKGGCWRVLRSSPQFGITLFIYDKLLNV